MAKKNSASTSVGASHESRTGVESLSDLMAAEFRPIHWIIPDLLPEGFALLAGRPKVGKSWLALDLALAIARTGPVLYLALEDSKRRLQSRVATLLGADETPADFEYALEWPVLDQGGAAQIEAWLDAHPGARAVVIDTMARVHPDSRNTDVYLRDNKVWGGVQRIASKRSGLLILAVHHERKSQGKSGGGSEPIESVSGSHGVTGSMDTVWVLRKEHGSEAGLLHVSGRDVSETSRETFQRDGAWFDAGQALEAAMTRQRDQVLGQLEEHGPLAAPQLAALTGISDHAMRQRLYRLEADGLVTHRQDRSWGLRDVARRSETLRDARRLASRVVDRPEWTWAEYRESVEQAER